jgi:hypothetical protein
MGLDINTVQFLIAARKSGVQFGDVLTIGRQDLNVYPAKLQKLFQKHDLPGEEFRPGIKETGFGEPVFRALGAKSVRSLDASSFEDAEVVHDLNLPIADEWKQRFDLVYDGGTIEHVFNFPQALKNCMEMVKVGGVFVTHTVGNNWWGHGFYQFSPELFYRALSESNGFRVDRMIAHFVGPYGRWYEVSDPDKIQSRVEAVSFGPINLLVQATRTAAVPVFATAPQQSDYVQRWKRPEEVSAASGMDRKAWSASRPKLARGLPGVARLLNVAKMGWRMYSQATMRNRRNFRPIKRP